MASALSGIARFAAGYVVGHFGGLLKVSAVPFVIITGLAVLYTQFILSQVFVRVAEGDDPPTVDYELLDLIHTFVLAYFWMWLIVRVIRLVLSEEAPGLLGPYSALIDAAWLLAYVIGLVLVAFLPGTLAALGGFVLVADLVPGDIGGLIAVLMLLAAAVFTVWVMGRLFVGFQPVALGERPGFFSGWRLTAGVSWGLFLQVVAILVAAAIVLSVGGYVVAEALVWVLISDGGDAPAEATAEQAPSLWSLVQYLMLFQVVATVIILPVYWLILVMFVESYRRLSAG